MNCKLKGLRIYKLSLILVRDVYLLVRKPSLNKDFFLTDQIKRAAVSVVINIAEGYGRHTRKDFAQFLSIALGSANETIALLDVITEVYKNINIDILKDKYDQLGKQIYSFRNTLTK